MASVWIECSRSAEPVRARLICLPYAGGGARVFHDWPPLLPPYVERITVLLPGRGSRTLQPACSRMGLIASALASALAQKLDKPLVVYGHSMGALLGFELIRVLQNNPAVTFNHLFVAASRAPHIQSSEPISNLPRTDLVSELRKLNGMPEELLSNEELLESILPTLRADLAACERYQIPPNCCIACPITALGGEADVSVPCERLYAWNRHTRAPFQAIVVPGDHFFLNTHRTLVVSIVAAIVERASQCGGTRVTGPTGIGQTIPQL